MQNTQHWIIFGWTRQGCHSCEKQGNPCERGATWLAGSHVMENLNQALGLHRNPAARAGGVLQVPKHSALEMVSHSKKPITSHSPAPAVRCQRAQPGCGYSHQPQTKVWLWTPRGAAARKPATPLPPPCFSSLETFLLSMGRQIQGYGFQDYWGTVCTLKISLNLCSSIYF